MKAFVIFFALIALTASGCHSGLHLFNSDNGMMIQELRPITIDDLDAVNPPANQITAEIKKNLMNPTDQYAL